MKLLLHTCCGPCTIYPLQQLRDKNIEVTGYFYNPNIHPFKEFRRRLNTLQEYANLVKLDILIDKQYGLTEFVRKVAFNEQKRCTICYDMRLENTVSTAAAKGFDSFSTTLLYSRYQRHDQLISLCNKLSVRYQIPFYYEDFRDGWQEAIDRSKELEMYRQPYCGCIYSEQERYDKSLRKRKE